MRGEAFTAPELGKVDLLPPVLLALVLVLAHEAAAARARTASLEPRAVDAGRDAWYIMAALDGSGPALARRIEAFRRHVGPLEDPGGLLLVPGLGSRLLHRWHADIDWMARRGRRDAGPDGSR